MDLEYLLNKNGYTVNDLKGNKLIAVDAYKSNADIYCFGKTDKGTWKENIKNFKGFVGKNGVGKEIYEGSGMTPAGIFDLGEGFYQQEKPDTSYPMFKITENTYWVDDINSEYYNRKIESEYNDISVRAEHMIETEKYYYGIVVEYNTNPIIKGKGSAIFMHCSDEATRGCVGVEREKMKQILQWLDYKSKAQIYIIKND